MSDLARIIASGSGKLEYRLVIAGALRQWVTRKSMTGTLADGRIRTLGLKRAGLRTSETVSLLEGRLEQDGFSATIVDMDGAATAEFMSESAVDAWLTVTATATATTFDVNASAGLNGLYLQIGQETVLVTGEPTAVTITVTRACWDTTATAHCVQTGDTPMWPRLRNVAPHMINRRAELYAHGPSELTSPATGTLVWRGIVQSGVRSLDSAAAYEIPLSPLATILEQNIGPKSKEPIGFRGIYYAAAGALWFRVREFSTASYGSSSAHSATVQLDGFFAAQGDFITALQAAFDAALLAASFTQTVRVIPVDGGYRWGLTIGTTTTPKYVEIVGGSAVDGDFGGGGTHLVVDADGIEYPTLAASSIYTVQVSDTPATRHSAPETWIAWPPDTTPTPRTVPRACYRDIGPYGGMPADEAAWPSSSLYLEDISGIAVGDMLTLSGTPPEWALTMVSVSAVDATNGFVTAAVYDEGLAMLIAQPYLNNSVGYDGQWRIIVAKTYSLIPCSLTGFRDALVTSSVNAMPGQGPRIFAADVGDWAAAAEIAGTNPVLARRVYVFTEPTRLSDLLEHECRLYGLVPYIDASQKIQLRRLAPALATDTAALTLTAANRGVSSGFGQIEDSPDGVITTCELSTRWNARTAKYDGPTITAQNVLAISDVGSERILEIKPLVSAEVEPVPGDSVADLLFSRTVFFGTRCRAVTFNASLAAHGALLGDVVNVVIPQLPMNGVRGLSRKGRLVGRQWDFDSGRGTLKVVFFDLRGAGYAPSALVASAANVTANTWDLTIDTTEFLAFEQTVSECFAAGYAVRVTQRYTATPTVLTGTVVSVSGSVVRVTFSGVFTDRSPNDVLEFDARTSCTAAQLEWAFIASNSGVFASGSAQQFSP